ncbi:hypothetical protein A9762_12040 [Pandoraea sp. ISTKB]|nr:hypothetical protein A9762_12040 [Pandoraea sp. ISTKB]
MRSAGFSFCPNETSISAVRAYDAALADGDGYERALRAQRSAQEALHFYGLDLDTSLARMRRVIPNLETADYAAASEADVHSGDFSFADMPVVLAFIREQQRFADGSPGVYYSTPSDRSLTAAMHAQFSDSVNTLLEYRDLPPFSAAEVERIRALANRHMFDAVRGVEHAVRRQTIGIDGLPLRAPSVQCTVVGHATREAAIEANNGECSGIEEMRLPFGIPIGFASRGTRLLILSDARYLEYNFGLLPDFEPSKVYNVQTHKDFLAHVQRVVYEYERLKDESLLDPKAWCTLEILARVLERFNRLFQQMKAALAPYVPHQGFFTVPILAELGGQRAARFDDHFPPGFLDFVDAFRTRLYNAASRRMDELIAHKSMLDGMQKFTRDQSWKRPVGGQTQPGRKFIGDPPPRAV